MMRFHFITLSITLLMHCASIHAETLEEAWLSALSDNHTLKSAQAMTLASEEQLHSAQGQHLPTLSVETGYTQFSAPLAAKTEIAQQTYQFNTAQAGGAKAQAVVSVPLFTSGRISHAIDSAQSAVYANQANEASTSANLKLEIASAYLAVLRADSALQTAQQHLSHLSASAQQIEQNYQQGLVDRHDTLAANVAQLNAEQKLKQVQNQLSYAQAHYNQLLNRPFNTAVQLEAIKPHLPSGALESLTQTALAQRQELQGLNHRVNTLKQQASSVQAELLPQISANGGYVYQENRYQAHQGLFMAGVDMQWKLDAGTSHRHSALNQQVAALKEQYEELSNQIRLQIKQSLLDIEESQQRQRTAQQTIVQSEENYRVVQARYTQGLVSHTELLQAETLRSEAKNNKDTADYDYIWAVLRLRHAIAVL
jgi:outer membrane protein TolC